MKSLFTKIKNLIKRGYVSKVLDDDKELPFQQVSYLGKIGYSERLSPYGLDSNPPQDIQVLVFSVNGVESNRLSMAYSQANRFKGLKEGEVVVGNPETQAYIKFAEDNTIEIKATQSVTIEAPSITIKNGTISIESDADISVTGTANINATQINLGSGGPQIARKGDAVLVNVGGTDYTGVITGGGTNTST